MSKRFFFLFVFFLVFLDQGFKLWVFFNKSEILFTSGWWWEQVPFLKITYIENSGMAFGWLNHSGDLIKLLLTLFRVFAVIFMFYFVFKKIRGFSFFSFVFFGLLIAGALGNCIDSVFYESLGFNVSKLGGGLFSGNVIDMIKISFFPPVFNLADSFITIGCFIGLLFYKKLSILSS